MKKIILIISLITFLFTVIFAQNEQKKIALVIGNANYQYGGKLQNPVNDANLMTSTLQNMGFTVITKTNATKTEMDNAILEFSRKLANYDVALFYYAGHGVQVNGKNYLIPIDAKLDDQVSVSFEAVGVAKIVEQFEYYPDNLNIVILDACRDNPFRSWQRGGNRGFKAISAPAGTIIAFATREGETASDGKSSNGLFTEQLVIQMKKNQTIEQVFKNTRIEVLKISDKKQCPQEWSMFTGDFYFVENNAENNNNNIVVEPIDDIVIDDDENKQKQNIDGDILLPVFKGKYPDTKFGFINSTSKLIVDYVYSDAGFFHEGLAFVGEKINDKTYYGFINLQGEIVIGTNYDRVGNFSEGLCFFSQGNTSGCMNKEGEVIFYLPEKIDDLYYPNIMFSENVALVRLPSVQKDIIIDKSGNIIFDSERNFFFLFGAICKNGLIPVYKNTSENNSAAIYGYIDKFGNIKIDFKFKQAQNFSEGLAGVSINDLYGFINTSGKMVIQPNYKYVSNFSEGVSSVTFANDIFGYIDKNGKQLFKDKSFLWTNNFFGNKAVVTLSDGNSYVIDKEGNLTKISSLMSIDLRDNYYRVWYKDYSLLVLENEEELLNNIYINLKSANTIWKSENKAIQWCFPKSTRVQTQTVDIEMSEVTKGMQILSYNPDTQETEFATVEELIAHKDQEYNLTRITFINSQTLYASINNEIELLQIEGTENHPILTTNGFKPLGNITENDKILYYSEFNNKIIECSVLQVEKNYRTVSEVFNIKLENGNPYIINNIIASPKCPFVYVKQNGIYQQIDEILKNQVSDKLDRYDYLEIPFEMIENNILLIKIAEQKDEISYLDHIYLQVGEQIIQPECKTEILQKIQSNDNEYYQLQKGKYFELKFNLPENIDKTIKIQLVAKGYYELFNYTQNR